MLFFPIYIHWDDLNEVHACAKFLPFKLVVSLHGCLADVTMDYVSQQDEIKNLRSDFFSLYSSKLPILASGKNMREQRIRWSNKRR